MTFEEFLEKVDRDIIELKSLKRNKLYYISMEISGNNIPESLSNYYTNKNCGTDIKVCRFGKFDVIIWWD